MSKHYVITNVAEDGTITARPTDNAALVDWTHPVTKEEHVIHPTPGHVIEATLLGITRLPSEHAVTAESGTIDHGTERIKAKLREDMEKYR